MHPNSMNKLPLTSQQLEKFQRSLALPNVKYNCVVLFLSQLYLLFIYASKYFLIGNHCEIQSEFSDLLEKSRSECSSSTVLQPHTIRENILV